MEIKMAKDGFPIEQGEYSSGLMRMFTDMIATASPEIREEMRRRFETEITRHERWMGLTKNFVDLSKAVDLGDFHKGWGSNYLYIWLNGEGVPFYAGQAKDRDRVSQFSSTTRSEAFKNVVRNGGCHAVVVAKHIPDSKINELERGLIAYLKWEDYPIVNNRDLPSPMECSMAKRIAKVGKSTMKQVFLSHTQYKTDFTKIFTVLDGVVGVEWIGECATFSNSCRA